MSWIHPPSPWQHWNYDFWDGGLSDQDIEHITRLGESMPEEAGVVGSGGGEIADITRFSQVRWIPLNADDWLNNRLTFMCRQMNGKCWQYDLYGFCESFQFTTYYPNNQHYTWHQDCGQWSDPPRKLSMVVMLSDPEEFEGGELQIYIEDKPFTLEPKKGRVYAFPSYILHRVTPVTKGIRKSLVVWVAGPKPR